MSSLFDRNQPNDIREPTPGKTARERHSTTVLKQPERKTMTIEPETKSNRNRSNVDVHHQREVDDKQRRLLQ